MHETYTFLNKIIENKLDKKILVENYVKILSIISPVIPHLTFECMEMLKVDTLQKWPSVDKKNVRKPNY